MATETLTGFLGKISYIYPPKVVTLQDHVDDGGPCVFVGCGRWAEAGASLPPQHLVFNNKEVGPRYRRHYTSVVRLAMDPPPGFLEAWSLWGERPLAPAAALARLTLVVEDASPDSVFGVLLLLARLAGVDVGEVEPAWVEAVDHWERCGDADDPWTSWCALASALAHRNFPPGAEVPPRLLANAWADVLRFAADAVVRSLPPTAIPTLSDLPSWRNATAALRQEHELYRDWLSHATATQLSLPLTGTSGRRLMVDGLLFVEDQLAGAAKVFYRNDRERSPLGRGFTFAAHHRPAEIGTGNDVTIAVDTRQGVDLRELWHELERRETAAWDAVHEVRPAGNPRALDGVHSRHDQPWYITPDGTLIGAPRRLEDGRPGTKLGWSDVRDAVWAVYNPLRNVRVCGRDGGEPVPLAKIPAEAGPGGGKRLLIAHWPRRGDEAAGIGPRALSGAPIVLRMLAALVGRSGQATTPGLDDLPAEGTWERLDLAGGFAVVADDGLFVLDDWRERRLAVEAIRRAFEEAESLDRRLRELEIGTIRPLVADVRTLLDAVHRWPDSDALILRAATAASRLTELRGSHALPPDGWDASRVRDALDRRWGLERRLSALEAEVRAIEASLRSLAELRFARVSRFIALYAFPVVVADVFGPTLGKAVYSQWFSELATTEPPAWFLLLFIMGLCLATALLLFLHRISSGRKRMDSELPLSG